MPGERLAAPPPTEFIPGPEVQQPAPIPIHLRPGESAFAQVLTAAVSINNDPSMQSVGWHDAQGNHYKVSGCVFERPIVEKFGHTHGIYNKISQSAQNGVTATAEALSSAPVLGNIPPISELDRHPKVVNGQQSFRGVTWRGGPAWDGLATRTEQRKNTPYRTVDIYSQDGTLKEMRAFWNDEQLAKFIDSNRANGHGGGHGDGHGGGHDSLGFDGFELSAPKPPEAPRTDRIPYSGPRGPVSVAEALEQGKRLGNDPKGGDALVGFTWNDGKHTQTITRGVMVGERDKHLYFNDLVYQQPAVVVETSYVTPRHEGRAKAHRVQRDNRPGGTVQRRYRVMTLNELQEHFVDMSSQRRANPRRSPAQAHWRLPQLDPSDMTGLALRQQELDRIHHHYPERLQADPFQATLGRLATRAVVDPPNRSPGDPTIRLSEAVTLVNRPDDPANLQARVEALWASKDPHKYADARLLKKAVDERGIDVVAGTAKSMLTEIRESAASLGIGEAADLISISNVLIALSRYRYEATANPSPRRADRLVNADPFENSAMGLQVRRQIIDSQLAQLFNQATLVEVGKVQEEGDNNGGEDNDSARYTTVYGRREQILNMMPTQLKTSVFDILNKVGPKNEVGYISERDWVTAGELLMNHWIDPQVAKEQNAAKVREAYTRAVRSAYVPIK